MQPHDATRESPKDNKHSDFAQSSSVGPQSITSRRRRKSFIVGYGELTGIIHSLQRETEALNSCPRMVRKSQKGKLQKALRNLYAAERRLASLTIPALVEEQNLRQVPRQSLEPAISHDVRIRCTCSDHEVHDRRLEEAEAEWLQYRFGNGPQKLQTKEAGR